MNNDHNFEVLWQNIGVWWQEIVNWYLAQPIYGQILVIVGVIALLALAVVIVYYVIKGVAYLVYYIFKGVYYLLKGIGVLFYKLFETLYYAISGESKPESNPPQEKQAQPQVEIKSEPIAPVQKTYQSVNPDVSFCSECGNRFSDSMIKALSTKGDVFCIHCGSHFSSNSIKMES
ncbi:MAG: hypothetical protein ACW986_01935 [Promethearchaeota archaeon]|jgi:hypothetical protein